MAWFDPTPGPANVIVFAVGWSAGWLMLWRLRPLPAGSLSEGLTSGRASRPTISVVVPARNEARSIGALVASVVAQLRDGDDLVVVDDHSTDETAEIARRGGATVIAAPPLPPGWAGKPHACHVGAAGTDGELIVFLDADVRLGRGALDGLSAVVGAASPDLVSMQPWHHTERPYEQCSLPFNIVALMGSAAFTLGGQRPRPHVAFGPVIACTRRRYGAIGGHAHPSVRSAVLEDIALARLVERTRLYTGTATTTTFRMYPGGWSSLVEGWGKGLGIGFDATPRWAALAIAAWISSVAGGWLTSPWFAVATVAQVAVFARYVGSFRWWSVVASPLLMAFFVAVFAHSLVRRRVGAAVRWKGRELRPDQDTG